MLENNGGFLLVESLLLLLCTSILILIITTSIQLLHQSRGKEIDLHRKWENELYELYQK
ncbi:MAG: hypothetical protein RR863_01070 [Erysipelotrichaceae bacterium]